MKRVLLVTAALGAAVALLAGLSLPPAHRVLAAQDDGAITGVIHVHTNRSDGRSSPDEVALAASRAGLDFVIFTDHGDGTRPPDPPTYRSGVLCLDGVEISTTGGHYLAIDMPAAPYPLGGEARDVVDDVRRIGGLGIVAHPDSPKADLRWSDWTLPFDGVEILNLDTAWRFRLGQPGWLPKLRLFGSLLAYPIRSEEAIGTLTRVSSGNARAFAGIAEKRRIVASGGVDAHARLGWRNDTDPVGDGYSLPFPGYETVFRTMTIRARTESPFTGDVGADAQRLADAIRAGRFHSAVVALASPPFFEFTAENRSGTAGEGEHLQPDGPLTLRVRSNAPPGFSTTILEGTRILATGTGREVEVVAPGESGVYRAEILAADWPGQPAWIVSNPIYIRTDDLVATAQSDPAIVSARKPLFDGHDSSAWRVESAATSRAQHGVATSGEGESALWLEYALAEGPPAGQFAALVLETPGGIAPHDRLQFTARADRPMRISVRARVAASPTMDESWSRSVYVDSSPREVTIRLNDMKTVDAAQKPLSAADVHSVLFVVDVTNTKPGSSGRLWLSRVEFQH